MNQKSLYDITEVCKMLGITSRTLRFYEDKGIIQSTTIGTSSRRQYTEEQLALIKNVLVLRTLGLSVKSIKELQLKELNLKNAVLSKRAEISASIDSRIREIDLLNDALCALDSGKDIFSEEWQQHLKINNRQLEIANLCTDAILNKEDEILYKYISSRLAKYMPKDVYVVVRNDTLAPLGDFIGIEKTAIDHRYPNKTHTFVKFSKLGLKITFVFYGEKIEGLWLNYYNTNERSLQ